MAMSRALAFSLVGGGVDSLRPDPFGRAGALGRVAVWLVAVSRGSSVVMAVAFLYERGYSLIGLSNFLTAA
jgi:hypothetical protein